MSAKAVVMGRVQQRASAVAQLLQSLLTGQPVCLAPQGFGEADPVADNATPQGSGRQEARHHRPSHRPLSPRNPCSP